MVTTVQASTGNAPPAGLAANSNLVLSPVGVLNVGIPTGSVVGATGSVNVQGGYYVNGVLQTGGATIAGSTTAGNLLTATGTSSGVFGNSIATVNGFGIGLGGVSANGSYQLNVAGTIGAAGVNGFVGKLVGGVNLNGGTLSNGTINNVGFSTTSSNFTSPTGTSNFIGGTLLSNGYAAVGTGTAPGFTGMNVNGGLSLANGFRPRYAAVTGTTLSNTTTPAILTTNYGTHFYITNSGFSNVTLPASLWPVDSNAYWVLRNATGSYLSVSTTYTGTGGGSASTLTIPPANSTTIMFVANTTGSGAYAFF